MVELNPIELKEGAHVYTSDGDQVGSLDRVVIDPRTDRVAGIVVKKGILLTNDKVIPENLIAMANKNGVTLKPELQSVDLLPNYEETSFVVGENRNVESSTTTMMPVYYYPPVGAGATGIPMFIDPNSQLEEVRHIPKGTVPLQEGSPVYNADGQHIGDVIRVLFNLEDRRLTHIVITYGFLSKEEKLIPANWILRLKEDRVDLAIGDQVLEKLPLYEE